MESKLHLEVGEDMQPNHKSSGDLPVKSFKPRPPSPAPYAWHDVDREKTGISSGKYR